MMIKTSQSEKKKSPKSNGKYLLLAVFIAFSVSIKAQVNPYACVDTTQIQLGHDCTVNGRPDFRPICACDGKTYINQCVAQYLHGVNPINLQDGPCEDFIDYFYPNPFFSETAGYDALHYYVDVKDPSTIVHVVIMGISNFSIYYIQDYTFTNLFSAPFIYQDDIPVYNFPRGIYLIRASTSNYVKYKKFVKM